MGKAKGAVLTPDEHEALIQIYLDNLPHLNISKDILKEFFHITAKLLIDYKVAWETLEKMRDEDDTYYRGVIRRLCSEEIEKTVEKLKALKRKGRV